MTGKALIAHRAPDAFLMKSIQLVLVVHVMILATDISKGGLTDVAFIDGLSMSHGQMSAKYIRSSKIGLTHMAFVGRRRGIRSVVTVQFEMFLQFEAFVERLTTDLTYG